MRGKEEEVASDDGTALVDATDEASAVGEAETGRPADATSPLSTRSRIFATMLAGLARRYKWEYRDQPGSNDLCIVFSSTARRFALQGQRWPGNVLFLVDRDDAYFVIGAGRSADLLGAAIDEAGIDRVLMFGSSKAGFGAVLWTALCARRFPARTFRCVAFSPQTKLFPFNGELDFPSYRLLWRRAEADPRVMSALRAYGDLRIAQTARNALITFVYGERNLVDRREAGRLFAPHFRKYPVPIRFHGSMIPFTVRHLDEEALAKWLRNLYSRADEDADLRGILPSDPDELIAEFKSMRWIPSLPQFVQECLDLGAHP